MVLSRQDVHYVHKFTWVDDPTEPTLKNAPKCPIMCVEPPAKGRDRATERKIGARIECGFASKVHQKQLERNLIL